MKKEMVALLLAFLSCTAVYAQKASSPCKFVFSGKIIGQDSGFIYLSYMNKDNHYLHDSCALKDGRFRFQGAICEPTHAFFWGRIKSRSATDPNFTDIFLEPKVINGIFKINNFTGGKIKGSKTQNEYEKLVKRKNKIYKPLNSVLKEYRKAKNEKEMDKSKELGEEVAQYRAALDKVDYDFMNNHPDSYVSVDILHSIQYGPLTLDSIKMFYARLSPKIQQSQVGKSIHKRIQMIEAVAIGKPAPDFVQNDIHGKPVSLKSYRGKYVLLDFWASWCGPCRQENPYLKKAYKKYKNKGFTILGISLDTDTAKWKAAVKKDKLHWPQLSDLKGMQNSVAMKYTVIPIPDNFLIDPNGKIIARDIGGEDIVKKLNEIFEKGL